MLMLMPGVNRALVAQVWSLMSEQILDNYLPCQYWNLILIPTPRILAALARIMSASGKSLFLKGTYARKLKAFHKLINFKLYEITLHLFPSGHIS